MMNKEKKYLNKRDWLNPPDHWDTGAIQFNVTFDLGYVDVNLSIWDCSRKATLGLGFGNEKEAKQRADKIDKLINHLEEIKVAMGMSSLMTMDTAEIAEADQ